MVRIGLVFYIKIWSKINSFVEDSIPHIRRKCLSSWPFKYYTGMTFIVRLMLIY